MLVDFLADHGIPVQQHGGATSAIPTIGLTDLRIDVPEHMFAEAKEALVALREGKPDDHPFRGSKGGKPEPYQAPVEVRKWPYALVLAFLVPIGGGHFYARHGAAGIILAAGCVGALAGALVGMPALLHAWLIIVVADAVLAPFAVRRFNAQAVPTDGTQRAFALGVLAAAFVVAIATS